MKEIVTGLLYMTPGILVIGIWCWLDPTVLIMGGAIIISFVILLLLIKGIILILDELNW